MQRNWIGRSEGAEVTFRCEDFGSRPPDRLSRCSRRARHAVRATFFVMAPEPPGRGAARRGDGVRKRRARLRHHALNESNEERGTREEKTGVPLGRTVTNPVNGEQIPMYVAD